MLVVQIPLRPFLVSLFWMLSRYRERVFSIELELFRHDTKRSSRDFTLDRPIEYIVGDFRDLIRKLRSWDRLCDFRKWCLEVRPSESLSQRFILREGVFRHIHRLVISEVTVLRRKKLSPFASFHHVFDDFGYEHFVFFFGILLIQDAVRSIS